MVEKTMDAYGYCHNNPVRFVDPTGMESDDIITINKQTGYTKIIKAEGDDIVVLIDPDANLSDMVVDSYVYGKNGSFNRDTQIEVDKGPVGMQNLGQKITFSNSDPGVANKFFEFASQSDVEFGLIDVTYINSLHSESIVMTNYNSNSVGATAYASEILRKNEDAIVGRVRHDHPGGYSNFSPPKPSGFDNKLIPDNSSRGDRINYINTKKEFGDRMPQYYEVFYAEGSLNFKYNGKKAFKD